MSRKLNWIQGATSAELRSRFLDENFRPRAMAIFGRDAGVQCVLLVIGQYWQDEAEDAVHLDLIPAEDEDPVWPDCVRSSPFYADEEGRFELTPRGDAAMAWSEEFSAGSKYPELDENSSAITAFASCSEEVASQEDGVDVTSLPYALARRGSGGVIEIEVVGRVRRPEWEDRFDVGFDAPEGVVSARLYDNQWSAPSPAAKQGTRVPERPSFWQRLFGRKSR